MILAAITDRKSLDGDLVAFVERAIAAGIDWIQIREKDLSGRELFALCERAAALRNPCGVRLFVNGRADVALAAGMHGVHLPSDAPSPEALRACTSGALQIGVSCHNVEEVQAAELAGADYVFYAPVFPSTSKPGYGPVLGLEKLAMACESVKIPVLALGGVSAENAAACVDVGAAGVAGISLFQKAADLAGLASRLRGQR